MTVRLAFLIRLRPGADRAEFERFVREVEVPLVQSWPSTVGQRTLRVDGLFEDAGRPLAADYVDLIEVTDVTAYEADMAAAEATPAFADFVAGWERLVDGDDALRTSEVVAW